MIETRMQKTYKTIEFTTILEQIKELAHTEHAKAEIDAIQPFLSVQDVNNRLRETKEAWLMLTKYGTPPFVTLENVGQLLMTADKEGILTAEQLEYIAITLTAVRRLKDYLIRCHQLEVSLSYYDVELDDLPELRDTLSRQIRNGKVDDFATKLLKDTRAEIEKTENAMRMKADSVMKANKSCLSDNFSTMRNGHICIPIKKECRYQIQGNVIDQSSTGATVFMEPSSVAKYYDELNSLKLTEENEERRILYTLTVQVAQKKEVFDHNVSIMEKLDFIFARAELGVRQNAVLPVMNTERYLKIEEGRHPLLDPEKCVPLEFEIGQKNEEQLIHGIIITGPNTGGKTVSMKTVGLISLMAQCGLMVPAKTAEICMNSQILCDIGDGQNISENLSTFSAHITNALDILQNVNQESLVLMDELGSGTDPAEGMGIAIAILEKLRESGCLFLVTTHYPEVKNYADNMDGIMNARMAFDRETLQPQYRLELGEAGESCALYIAKKLGMPADMLERAQKEAYGYVTDEFADIENTNVDGKEKKKTLHAQNGPRIQKAKKTFSGQKRADQFHIGDSVMLYPEKKIGIVCEKANEKGVLRIQLQKKKIYVNHTRLKLQVAATELYPDDYDFSIIFDSVAVRKAHHQMDRKYCEDMEIRLEDGQ